MYLDHNATTPLDDRVLEAMLPFLRGHYGNPSSLHRPGRIARSAVETAREQVAALVNAHPTQVVFTSGGTEANNLALKGVCAHRTPGSLVISTVEHSSVLQPAQGLGRSGWRIAQAPVDGDGRVSVDAVCRMLDGDTCLVSVMTANNETGVIQDIAGIAAAVRDRGAIFHTDAVQALGKIEVDFAACGAHLMSLSAHKVSGPKGAGALVFDRGVQLEPQLQGGGHELGLRSGTENVAGIVGFGAAAELARGEWRAHAAAAAHLRDYLERRLHEVPGIEIFCERARRLPNTVFMALPGIEGEALKMNLDRAGIAVSSGSACTSGTAEPSHVLMAMGVANDAALGAVRVSLGRHNTHGDVDILIDALKRQKSALGDATLLAWNQ